MAKKLRIKRTTQVSLYDKGYKKGQKDARSANAKYYAEQIAVMNERVAEAEAQMRQADKALEIAMGRYARLVGLGEPNIPVTSNKEEETWKHAYQVIKLRYEALINLITQIE